MRNWNLHFSGKQGSDAETFLLRIKKARAIVPITDSDFLKMSATISIWYGVILGAAWYWKLAGLEWFWNDVASAVWRLGYQYALCDEIFRLWLNLLWVVNWFDSCWLMLINRRTGLVDWWLIRRFHKFCVSIIFYLFVFTIIKCKEAVCCWVFSLKLYVQCIYNARWE